MSEPWGNQAPGEQPGWGQTGQPGQADGYPTQQPYGGPASGRATTVMVLGIASLVLMMTCGIGFIAAIIALAIAGGAEREIAGSGGRLSGQGQIRAGRIMSWITIGLTAAGVLALIGVLAVVGVGRATY